VNESSGAAFSRPGLPPRTPRPGRRRLAGPLALPRGRLSAQRRLEIVTAYLFILPTLIGFLVFTAGPLLAGLGLSFFTFDFFAPPKFAGLDNFRLMLDDRRLWPIFGNTVRYVVIMVLLDLVWALGLALSLNSYMPAVLKVVFRSVFFFPILTSGAVTAIVWRYLFNRDRGIINYFLSLFGVPPIPWLASSNWVIPSVSLMSVWNGVGFNTILLLAGLQSIPKELFEAAEIDGANRWAAFRYVTLPLLTPTIFFILVKGLIAVFQLFSEPYSMTGGGPGDASRTIVMYIYEVGFRSLRLGYASSIALVLFAVILTFTIVQFVISRRWVFYR
jgi:multiple sugar transport system permease protein